MKKERNSYIEMLRIISMIMIVVSHWNCHSGLREIVSSNLFNRLLIANTSLGNIGVIIFFMITGYFSSNNLKVNIKKIITLILEVLFYSLGIYVIMLFSGNISFSINDLITSVLPVTFRLYWFVTVYVVLLLLSPYINKLLNNLDIKELKKMLLILTIIFFIFPTILKQDFYGNELIQAIYFYILGFFVKSHKSRLLDKYSIFIFLVSVILLILQSSFIVILSDYINIPSSLGYHLYERNSILSVLFCFSLFYFISNLKSFSNSIINFIASHTFAIYLISDNRFFRVVMWRKIFNVTDYVNSNFLILNMVVSLVIIFIFCIVVECIRKNTIELVSKKILDRIITN